MARWVIAHTKSALEKNASNWKRNDLSPKYRFGHISTWPNQSQPCILLEITKYKATFKRGYQTGI